jgi:hypothetical protein
MNTNMLSLATQLSNDELLAEVKLLAHQEREATAALIAHLAVLDERGLYLSEGCSSMFTYCVQVLHLSEHAAYGRIEAARAARRYPVILELLGNGSVEPHDGGAAGAAPHAREPRRPPRGSGAQEQAAGRGTCRAAAASAVCALIDPQAPGSDLCSVASPGRGFW